MNGEPPSSPQPSSRTWLERLGHLLGGELQSREELLEELRAARANGLLEADTLAMIEGALRVTDLRVADVMVPRAQVVSIALDADFNSIVDTVIESGHSRFPVHGEDRDEIVGILLAKDLLKAVRAGITEFALGPLLRPAVLIPEGKRLNLLLGEFKSTRSHMAIVVDEYGGVAGLVTIEDVLEEIVGEIDDEHDADDAAEELIRANGDGFHVSALTPIAEFNVRFGASLSDEDFDTLGGLVTASAGQVPAVGDSVEVQGFRFQVLEADDRRVHLLHLDTPA
ncbi:MAG: CBS domain-containing protein [Xanthomonadales bacterium]|nr:CBS domain-containing protein [Xanthomonadales bacterium]